MQEQKMWKLGRAFLVAFLASVSALPAVASEAQGVTYDGRSLIINGSRELLFSGSIHYPRSTPEVKSSCVCFLFTRGRFPLGFGNWQMPFLFSYQMWGDILQKAKKGGLNVIQTYVFWNIHEPVQGQVTLQHSLVFLISWAVLRI